MASLRWFESMLSLCSRSAIVRLMRRILSWARAERAISSIAAFNSDSASASSLQNLRICDGGMRPFFTLPARKLHVSTKLAFDQLALVETLAIGCHAVNRAQVTASDDVLIIGAGPIGLTVLEFARAANAAITILELNAARRDFVEQHYPGVNVVASLPDESAFQIVFDATGNPNSMAATLRFARFTGRIVYVGITKEPVLIDDPLFHRRELTLLASRNAVASDFPHILGMIQSGQINTRPWISHRCDFSELPAQMDTWLSPESRVIKADVNLEQ